MQKDNSDLDSGLARRKSLRLKGHDYSHSGLYFITICIRQNQCLLGNITDGTMELNAAGVMLENQWLLLPQRFKNICLHEYVVMPNHFHAILEIVRGTGNHNENAYTLGTIIGAFVSITTNEYILGVKNENWKPFNQKLWKRSYWDHIIHNEYDHNRITKYIIDNPSKWENNRQI